MARKIKIRARGGGKPVARKIKIHLKLKFTSGPGKRRKVPGELEPIFPREGPVGFSWKNKVEGKKKYRTNNLARTRLVILETVRKTIRGKFSVGKPVARKIKICFT